MVLVVSEFLNEGDLLLEHLLQFFNGQEHTLFAPPHGEDSKNAIGAVGFDAEFDSGLWLIAYWGSHGSLPEKSVHFVGGVLYLLCCFGFFLLASAFLIEAAQFGSFLCFEFGFHTRFLLGIGLCHAFQFALL